MASREETYSYKGWLNSDSLIKRAFAVLGHAMLGELFILILFLILAALLAGIGALFGN